MLPLSEYQGSVLGNNMSDFIVRMNRAPETDASKTMLQCFKGELRGDIHLKY